MASKLAQVSENTKVHCKGQKAFSVWCWKRESYWPAFVWSVTWPKSHLAINKDHAFRCELCLYDLIFLQARMYKSRIEIIEKLLGVLELDTDKNGYGFSVILL